MIVSAIVAADLRLGIGYDNKLPWHLPEDLKFFKRTTTNHSVVMGRNTLQSIGKALPNRTNFVLSKQPKLPFEGVTIVKTFEQAIEQAQADGETELFVIGGGEVYRTTQHLWDKLYFTRVETIIPNATVFFPELDWSAWHLCSQVFHSADEIHSFPFVIETWEKLRLG